MLNLLGIRGADHIPLRDPHAKMTGKAGWHDQRRNDTHPASAHGAGRTGDGQRADRGTVSLATFECRDVDRSGVVERVCHDSAQRSMIVSINGVYHQYCGLQASIFDGLMGAPSMGQFFNRRIRASADGYQCPK